MIQIKDVVVLEEAVQDLEIGRDFYREQERHIGDYFWDCLISDIESLYLYAGIHSEVESLSRMLSKRFPYAIYYYLAEDIAKILAILPMRRNPTWIKQLLQGRK